MNYLNYCIKRGITIKEAMARIDDIDPKILFIIENKRVVASLTDGDIRRYLLKGGNLSDGSINAGNANPKVASSEEEAVSLYHRKNYVAIPIVVKGELTNIYFGKRNSGEKIADLNIPVVINAGGKGTRLEPYTKILPKPLIPIGDLPIVEHIMQKFSEYGCDKFSMIVNYKKEIMKAYFQENEKKYNISWYDEIKPLGTGGGLCYLSGKIDRTFFFSNCDSLILSNYESMVRFHGEHKNIVTMICAYKTIKIPYGVIDMGVNGKINEIKEKPELNFLTNTGVYILEPEVFNYIKYDEAIDFPDVIEKIREDGGNVSIYPISENEWLDMGQFSELERMRKRIYGDGE